ncbi:MAG: MATE family efflux transporter [Bacillota bacterium]|jgi:putative MATE family efflux protein|nr:MATE family efflux transporter [Bacillota bacterium]HHT90622.1 MATE family efflux transporter [Bacillota bacterium]
MQGLIAAGMWTRFKAKFIGDRKFYQMALGLIIPVIVQNTVTNLVNLLDNVMVGSLGTTHMSGVAIGNHLIFVFNLSIFGALSGAGIYGAQFAGAKDWESFRETLRLRLLVSVAITALAAIVLTKWSTPLLSLYLGGEGNPADSAAMLLYGKQYLKIMLWGLLPFALAQSYSSALREAGETVLPMRASIVSVFVNLVLNYILIFGKLGFPALGVQGAALATVLSRIAELAMVAVVAHRNHDRFPFLRRLYRSFRIGRNLAKNIMIKGMPLFVNEFLWSAGMITITQILSTRGLVVVGALNIASTFTNLFGVFYFSTGTAVAIVTGQALGAGDVDLAKAQVWRLLFFAVCLSSAVGLVLVISAGWITEVYRTEVEVRSLAAAFMRATAFYMPFQAMANSCYFAIRSGGRTILTMIFDSIYVWIICVPYTYALVALTNLGIETVYPLSQLIHPLKAILSLIVVRTGYWAKNLVEDQVR